MSEYAVIAVDYNDPECLKNALTDLGCVFEDHKIAQRLYGYAGDLRKDVANIIVRRKHVGPYSNDIGFLRQDNGSYKIIISEFDRNEVEISQKFLHKLKNVYSKHKSLKFCKQKGLVVTSVKTTSDGKIKISAVGR